MRQIMAVKRKASFERVWEQVVAVRSDEDCMKLLEALIKAHTSCEKFI